MRTQGVSLPVGPGVWGEGHMVTEEARLSKMSLSSSAAAVAAAENLV